MLRKIIYVPMLTFFDGKFREAIEEAIGVSLDEANEYVKKYMVQIHQADVFPRFHCSILEKKSF